MAAHEQIGHLVDVLIRRTSLAFRGLVTGELLNEVAESFAAIDWRPQRVIDLGDERYLVLLLPKGTGAGSGVVLETEVAHLIQQRDGKTIRLDTFVGWTEALEAVGLSEQDAHADS